MGTNDEGSADLAPGDWRRKPTDLVPPPPRQPSPRAIQLVHAYAGAQRIQLILGVCFLIFGSVFSLIFCRGIGRDAALAFTAVRHEGVVVSNQLRTDVRIDRVHPHEITFRYVYGGVRRTAESTSTHSSFAELKEGDSVAIELVPSDPDVARIVGATSSTFGLWASFILLFPLVGFVLTVQVVLHNQREIRAHRVGVPIMATAVFRGLDTTSSSNEKNPFMVRWEFRVNGIMYEGKLSHMDHALLADLGESGELLVLYDPNNPKINTAYIA